MPRKAVGRLARRGRYGRSLTGICCCGRRCFSPRCIPGANACGQGARSNTGAACKARDRTCRLQPCETRDGRGDALQQSPDAPKFSMQRFQGPSTYVVQPPNHARFIGCSSLSSPLYARQTVSIRCSASRDWRSMCTGSRVSIGDRDIVTRTGQQKPRDRQGGWQSPRMI